MRSIFGLLWVVIICLPLNAQNILVTYETESKLDTKQLADSTVEDDAKMYYIMKLAQDFEELQYILKISDGAAQFELAPSVRMRLNFDNWHAQMEKERLHYVDSLIAIEQKTFLGKPVLVTEPSYNYQWQITTDTLTILTYPCIKAKRAKQQDDPEIEAWFAPTLPYSFGPLRYHGLPGLILQLTQNGKLVYRASHISFDESFSIVKPTSGLRMERRAYNEMVQRENTLHRTSKD
jgi:GLPGLI family protein